MKRLTTVCSVMLLLAFAFGAVGVSPAYSLGNDVVRVMVQYAPNGKAPVEKTLQAAGAQFHYTFDNLNAFAVSLPSAAAEALKNNANVLLVEEDPQRFPIGVVQSSPETVAAQSGQTVPYGVDMVQARDVWDANRDGVVDSGASTGSNRTICIIDSGLYTGHEDFQGVNVVGGYTTIAGGWASDGLGHGTHVAGTIAAMNNALGVVGVTPGTVNLYIVRVFGDDGAWAYASTLIDAANRCASAGANIISMSLGGSQSSVTENSGFSSLYNQGILSIAAAGNDGTTSYSYPASYSSVVSVAAIDSSMTVASFSQKNDQVELAAPGVGVLSTIPYSDVSSVTVDNVTYTANHIEFSGRGTASGALVNGGLCDSTGSWSGKVVLCQRGTVDFNTKVQNVQSSGGVAAIIYNNVSGNFFGTLGTGNSSAIVAISISMEDGQFLVANKLGLTATVDSQYFWPVSNYEYYDGTSMATPHVSAVAALVWSANPNASNAAIRDVLTSTAFDLGAAGRDTSYGFGLVQAKTAVDKLVNTPQLAVTVATNKATYVNGETVIITTTVKDSATGLPVSSASVTLTLKTANGTTYTGSGTTNTSGVVTLTYKVNAGRGGRGTYTVTSTATKTGYLPGSGTTTFIVQ